MQHLRTICVTLEFLTCQTNSTHLTCLTVGDKIQPKWTNITTNGSNMPPLVRDDAQLHKAERTN